jgi:hypothetical protein
MRNCKFLERGVCLLVAQSYRLYYLCNSLVHVKASLVTRNVGLSDPDKWQFVQCHLTDKMLQYQAFFPSWDTRIFIFFKLQIQVVYFRHKDMYGSDVITALILNLCIIWWWVISLSPRPLYSAVRAPKALNIRLGGPQSRSERLREQKSRLPILAIEPRFPLSRFTFSLQFYFYVPFCVNKWSDMKWSVLCK